MLLRLECKNSSFKTPKVVQKSCRNLFIGVAKQGRGWRKLWICSYIMLYLRDDLVQASTKVEERHAWGWFSSPVLPRSAPATLPRTCLAPPNLSPSPPRPRGYKPRTRPALPRDRPILSSAADAHCPLKLLVPSLARHFSNVVQQHLTNGTCEPSTVATTKDAHGPTPYFFRLHTAQNVA